MTYWDEITMLRLRLGRWRDEGPGQAAPESEAAARMRRRARPRRSGRFGKAARQEEAEREVESGKGGDKCVST